MTPRRAPGLLMTAVNRLRLWGRRGGGTAAGAAILMLLSVTAMAVISMFAHFATSENAGALRYERAGTQLEVLLRGLAEAALTERSLPSIALLDRALLEFQALRHQSVNLDSDTGNVWPDFDRRINELIRNKGNIAFDQDALIAMGAITTGLERMAATLDAKARERREGAASARRNADIANIAAGALMILGTVIFFILRDTTARKAMHAVSAGEAKLREITDAVPVLIASVDAGRRFRFHNKAYENDLGLKPEQVQGRTLLEVFGGETYATMRSGVDEVLAGYPVRFERAQRDAQGRLRDYAEHYLPRYGKDSEVVGFYSLTTDITEVRRIDRMKSEFVSMVSHELRTPLTSIRGSLGLIAGGVAGNLPDAAKDLVDIAKNNCERLIRLINDLLDTEKIEAGKMRFDLKVVELAPLISHAIAANEGFAGQHGVSLKLLANAQAVRVNVDSDGLSQVLTNLLSNAVKFSPPGGVVEVGLTRAQGRVRVEVRDRGPGIPAEFRDRIFQKFSQADSSSSRQKGGTGLGLNISKAIVERLGGTIGFTTQTGSGTTFFFELPVWQDAPPSVFAAGIRELKRPCVLVCEDDPDIARLIGMMLDRAGYDTDLAFTAARARELAATGPYCAMTVDLRLPDQDGIALMRMLRADERSRHLPIVVVSAVSGEGRIQINNETLSVSDWLEKPIDANRLVAAIRDAVAGRTQNRPRILHVEDDPDIQHVSAAIARDFATFEFAATLQEARARIAVRKFDLILLDLNLPEGEGSGWKLVADIEALVPVPPIVVFSARDVSHVERQRVAAVLVKSNISNEEFLATIQRVLDRGSPASAGPQGASLAETA